MKRLLALVVLLPTLLHASSVEQYIRDQAIKVGVNPDRAISIAQCESGLDPNSKGDRGWSVGLWQIYLRAHPEISEEQASDVMWSTDWALFFMKKGKWEMWKNCNTQFFASLQNETGVHFSQIAL